MGFNFSHVTLTLEGQKGITPVEKRTFKEHCAGLPMEVTGVSLGPVVRGG